MLLRNGRAPKPYQNGNWYMQTHVFSGIIILEGIMSAKMSGMDVDLELALCYRQSFWIMSWAVTWKFQIQTSSRIVLLTGITVGGCECGSIDSNLPYLSVIVVAPAQSAIDENGSWGRCVPQVFQFPWKPATIALFAEKRYWAPSYAKLFLMCQVPLLNVTDCIISFCIVLTVTTSTLYLNKIESSQQYLQIVDQSTEHCRWFSINSVGVSSNKLVCKGPGAQICSERGWFVLSYWSSMSFNLEIPIMPILCFSFCSRSLKPPESDIARRKEWFYFSVIKFRRWRWHAPVPEDVLCSVHDARTCLCEQNYDSLQLRGKQLQQRCSAIYRVVQSNSKLAPLDLWSNKACLSL